MVRRFPCAGGDLASAISADLTCNLRWLANHRIDLRSEFATRVLANHRIEIKENKYVGTSAQARDGHAPFFGDALS